MAQGDDQHTPGLDRAFDGEEDQGSRTDAFSPAIQACPDPARQPLDARLLFAPVPTVDLPFDFDIFELQGRIARQFDGEAFLFGDPNRRCDSRRADGSRRAVREFLEDRAAVVLPPLRSLLQEAMQFSQLPGTSQPARRGEAEVVTQAGERGDDLDGRIDDRSGCGGGFVSRAV